MLVTLGLTGLSHIFVRPNRVDHAFLPKTLGTIKTITAFQCFQVFRTFASIVLARHLLQKPLGTSPLLFASAI